MRNNRIPTHVDADAENAFCSFNASGFGVKASFHHYLLLSGFWPSQKKNQGALLSTKMNLSRFYLFFIKRKNIRNPRTQVVAGIFVNRTRNYLDLGRIMLLLR